MLSSEPAKRLRLLCWGVLSLLVLVSDYLTGPFIQLPILFLCPVTLATWYSGCRWGVAIAVVLPLMRIAFSLFWPAPWPLSVSAVNGLIQIAVLSVFAFLVDQAAQKRMLDAEVRLLRGILPICSFCKKIRNEDNVWEPLEGYISGRSAAQFSHSLCPECAAEHNGEIYRHVSKRREDGQ